MTKIKYLGCTFMFIFCVLLAATVKAQTTAVVSTDSVKRIVIAAPPQGTTMPLTYNGSSDKALITVTNRGAATGGGVGISGSAPVGSGVQGSGLIGVEGMGGANGTGVSGNSGGQGTGVSGTSNTGMGVSGYSSSGRGVYGTSGGFGVFGIGTRSSSVGVWGESPGFAVMGTSTSRGDEAGIYGVNISGGLAGRFKGPVLVDGNLTVKGPVSATDFKQPSDRNLKANFSTVNPRLILDRLVSIPIQTWTYKDESDAIRHIGPMAQDFRSAFNLGADDKNIYSVDAQGVSLAAIQGLYQMIQENDRKIEQQSSQIEQLQNRMLQLERRVGERARGKRRR